jgi:hypothetical protein
VSTVVEQTADDLRVVRSLLHDDTGRGDVEEHARVDDALPSRALDDDAHAADCGAVGLHRSVEGDPGDRVPPVLQPHHREVAFGLDYGPMSYDDSWKSAVDDQRPGGAIDRPRAAEVAELVRGETVVDRIGVVGHTVADSAVGFG